MNCINNINEPVNFRAKLEVTKIQGSAKRWENIANLFEKITPDSPKEIIKGYGSLKSGLSLDLVKDKMVLKDCCFSEWGTKKLAELTDLEVARKLKTILNLMKELVNIETKAIEEFNSKPHAKINNNITNNFRQNVMSKVSEATQQVFSNDNLLAKGLYI